MHTLCIYFLVIDDIDIAKLGHTADATELRTERDAAKVTKLQKELAEKNQEIESLQGQVRKLEIKVKIAEQSNREFPPPRP